MPASVTSISPRRASVSAPQPAAPGGRRPFRDNPRLILLGIVVLIGLLAAILAVANRSRFSPDFTSEFVLYALTAADLTMLAALVLVLAVGSELINRSVERWFNAPMDEILSSANQIAGDYYQERQLLAADQATRIARALASVDLGNPDVTQLRALIAPDVASQRVQMIEVYRVGPAVGNLRGLESVIDMAAPSVPPGYSPAAAERLAAQVLAGSKETRSIEALGNSGDLLHAASVIHAKADGRPSGVVVATDYLTGDLAARSRRLTKAFEDYNQLRVLKRPLSGVYLSFFLMVT